MISSWCQYVVNISHCINCESVWRLFTIEFKAHAPQKIWWSSFDIGNSTSQAQDFYVQMSSHPCKPPMLQPARVASMARWKGGPPRRFGWQPWSTECCCFFFHDWNDPRKSEPPAVVVPKPSGHKLSLAVSDMISTPLAFAGTMSRSEAPTGQQRLRQQQGVKVRNSAYRATFWAHSSMAADLGFQCQKLEFRSKCSSFPQSLCDSDSDQRWSKMIKIQNSFHVNYGVMNLPCCLVASLDILHGPTWPPWLQSLTGDRGPTHKTWPLWPKESESCQGLFWANFCLGGQIFLNLYWLYDMYIDVCKIMYI